MNLFTNVSALNRVKLLTITNMIFLNFATYIYMLMNPWDGILQKLTHQNSQPDEAYLKLKARKSL